jgi:hypothetical protein
VLQQLDQLLRLGGHHRTGQGQEQGEGEQALQPWHRWAKGYAVLPACGAGVDPA